jgi:pristinamycin I synthase-3/4
MYLAVDRQVGAQAEPTAGTRPAVAPTRPDTQPGTPVQEIVRDLFAEAAGLPRLAVGADSDFFEVARRGGRSPGAVSRLLTRVTRTFAVTPGYTDLRASPTPVRFAALIGDARAASLGPHSATEFSVVLPLRLRGRLDEEALAQALTDLGQRHTALRNSRLGAAGTRLRCLDTDDRMLELRLPADTVDLWSHLPLAAELARAYTARAAGGTPYREPCRPDTAPRMPWGDREPSTVPGSTSGNGHAEWSELSWRVSPHLHARLARCAALHGATLFMVAHAALADVLARLGAGPEVTVAAPVPARDDAVLRAAVGPYGRVLALPVRTTGAADFGELLARVRAAALTAYRAHDAPLAEPGGVALTVLQAMDRPFEAAGVTVTPQRPTLAAQAAVLSLTLTEHQTPTGAPAGLRLTASHSPAALSEETVTTLCRDLLAALETSADAPPPRTTT